MQDLNTWVEISESAYAHNLAFFKKLISKDTELSVVIKSNAYGHCMAKVAELALKYGVNSFCVHSLEEAMCLRKYGISQDILIMGPVILSQLDQVIKNNFRLVLYNIEHLNELVKLTKKMDKRVRVHLKLETGTHRQGIIEKK